jgi:hypothetical protein
MIFSGDCNIEEYRPSSSNTVVAIPANILEEIVDTLERFSVLCLPMKIFRKGFFLERQLHLRDAL